MLVIHGELDFRIPYPQGIGTFTALQRRGIESRLIIFPEENHWVLRPANSVQWYHAVLGWLDAHLKDVLKRRIRRNTCSRASSIGPDDASYRLHQSARCGKRGHEGVCQPAASVGCACPAPPYW